MVYLLRWLLIFIEHAGYYSRYLAMLYEILYKSLFADCGIGYRLCHLFHAHQCIIGHFRFAAHCLCLHGRCGNDESEKKEYLFHKVV